ncbi:phosphohydrolase [Stenotrophomonas maltophilia]|uniref:phosphohydrolase n=1 Tax=Stenotrophomonas maltophilia TaxID=40324 RepID=UPI0015F1CC34|nr:phosphohydrolase [Stenotrophomonas maltophilia]QDY48752.1 HD domain-containing protein [Stenotrophomonas maltophilia]
MNIVERAKELAHRAHAGQVDKAGRPYIEHVARVAAAVSDDPEAEAVAWLHDVLEDCAIEFVREVRHFHQRVNFAVKELTRGNSSDEVYYALIRNDPLALRVKLADIADNSSEERLALLDEKTAARLRRKYAKAIRELTKETNDGR